MNVLLTCAGRRNHLVECFQGALEGRGVVVAVDCSPDAPALGSADLAFVVPRADDPHYVDVLRDLCARHRIGLLVPLNDFELPVLAQAKAAFSSIGTVVAVSSPHVIDLCFDKWQTFQFLTKIGVSTAHTCTSLEASLQNVAHGALRFPLVVKPRWGSASVGVERVLDEDELRMTFTLLQRRLARTPLASDFARDPGRAVLVQQLLTGQEHGLDVVNDLAGRHVATFARVKLVMRAGETDQALTVVDPVLTDFGAALGSVVGHVANLDCDIFVDGDHIAVLEMNPRFGGGYPFSHAAGADIPAALVAWVAGRPAAPDWLRLSPGIAAAKRDVIVVRDRLFEQAAWT